ncbi:YfiR family protein [Aliikangiella sp. IMCC44359]|uniref:YfiR family protein n=1 Tax=Aliikangiella sp. IMCC44359 TaxID=3459125 RepID=UPI00403ACF0E
MVRCLTFVFICFLCISPKTFAAEGVNEDLAKSEIIRQLLSLVEWEQSSFRQKSSKNYRLCTYNDSSSYRLLKLYLKGLNINKYPLNISNLKDRGGLAACHAVFLKKPEEKDVAWILNHQITKETFFIIEGAGYALKGFHVSLYLNNKNEFDYELNPDLLISSQLVPAQDLLKYARVLTSNISDKVNLLRSLINYTEWSEAGLLLEKSESFKLCTFKDAALSSFITYFARRKTFKGKFLINQTIDSINQADDCHALLIGNVSDESLVEILSQRAKRKVLLIGNGESLGEKGVHYNLSPKKNRSHFRFEINLIAFKQTGHSPRFELFNSAVVIEKDYPELSRVLLNILRDTTWPESSRHQVIKKSVNLCIYQEPWTYKNLELFFAAEQTALKATKRRRKTIFVKQIDKPKQIAKCEAFLVGAISAKELSELLSIKTDVSLLLISYQPAQADVAFHYNLLTEPKKVSFKLDINKLEEGGFVAAKTLLDAALASNGGSK